MDGLVLHGGKEKVAKSFPFEKKTKKKHGGISMHCDGDISRSGYSF